MLEAFAPKYLGDPLNTVKVLSDFGVDEIAVMNTDDVICDIIFEMPKYVNRPISMTGSIGSFDTASKLIEAGFDRLGFTDPHINQSAVLERVVSYFGASSTVVNVRARPEELVEVAQKVVEQIPASEYVFHDVERAGSLAGLRPEFEVLARRFNDVNIAVSGGYSGGAPPAMTRVYYSARYAFPLRKAPFDFRKQGIPLDFILVPAGVLHDSMLKMSVRLG